MTALEITDIPQLLTQLTLEEEASLCSGSDFWHTQAVERLGIPAVLVTDGPHGLRKQAGASDHLGLNDSVPATCFPTAAGLGSTWDRELMRRVGEALGVEARANQVAVLLGPGGHHSTIPRSENGQPTRRPAQLFSRRWAPSETCSAPTVPIPRWRHS